VVAFVGILCGLINSLGGGGAAISLPSLLFLGVPPHIANASNRFGLVVGGITRVVVFHRKGLIDWQNTRLVAIPTALGALLGAYAEEIVNNDILDVAVVGAIILSFLLLVRGTKRFLQDPLPQLLPISLRTQGIFFAIGIWTGFIAIESPTFFVIALVLTIGHDLRYANAIKSVLMLLSSALATTLFSTHGDIQWNLASLLAISNMVGAWIGARAASLPNASKRVYAVLVSALALEISWMGWTNIVSKFLPPPT